MNLEQFKINAIVSAKAQGLSHEQSVSRRLLGPTGPGFSCLQRTLIIAYTQPPLYEGPETFLWMNASDLRIYKSTNWKPQSDLTFQEVMAYDDMFIDGQDVLSQLPPDIASKTYVNTTIHEVLGQLVGSGAVNPMLPPVQDLAQLRQINVASVADKQTIFVEDERQFYAYDLQSSEAEDAYTVRPVSGVGRWVLNGPSRIDSGVFS